MTDTESRPDINFTLGQDLYGVSVLELKTRLEALAWEKSRIEAELAKKQSELSAAHNLFGQKSPSNSAE